MSKLLIASLLLIGAFYYVSALELTGDPVADFDTFVATFRKKYPTPQETQKRFAIWRNNVVFIQKHNERAKRHQVSYTLGVNKYTDLTHVEFIRLMLGKKSAPIPHMKTHVFHHNPNQSVPASIDFSKMGYVTPVKDQGQCGSCWAFSATGALEALNFKLTKKLVSFSEKFLVDCSSGTGNEGCNGGYPIQAINYVQTNKGIPTEDSYPYSIKAATCQASQIQPDAIFLARIGKPVVIKRGDENALVQAIAMQGPVSVGIDASKKSFQFYKDGIYNEKKCSSKNLDHAVLAVGYDAKSYIVKNSWGTSWGNKGYIRIARNANNMCGIATEAIFATAIE